MPRALDALSDEALGREIWALWHHYFITNVPFTINGKPAGQITDEQLEAILPSFRGIVRVATFNQDTDNESLAGIEKGLRLCASGDFDRGGRMFRAYLERLDEARTGRRRQSAIAGNARPDYLQRVLTEIDEQKPGITPLETKEELKRRVGAPGEEPRIHAWDEDADEVQWMEKGKPMLSAPFSGLKDRLYKIRRRRSTG
jgi:hypothetical protein